VDSSRLDSLARSLTAHSPRRAFVAAVISGGLAMVGWSAGPIDTAAKKKGKRGTKKRKRQATAPTAPPSLAPLVFNQFGCVEVGQACRGDNALCCSSICSGTPPAGEGQPDTSQCVAHDAGTCNQVIAGLCTNPNLLEVVCNNRSDCGCFRTTSGSSVCAELFGDAGTSQCVESCRRDADCVTLGFPTGSTCASVSEGRCAGTCPSGMACLIPCAAVRPPANQMS
jgi:hypothetical protein